MGGKKKGPTTTDELGNTVSVAELEERKAAEEARAAAKARREAKAAAAAAEKSGDGGAATTRATPVTRHPRPCSCRWRISSAR